MARILGLALVLTLAPVGASGDGVPANPERSCSRTPPTTVRVFRRHARGSSIPARIDTVPRRVYVGRVLASGAMPADRPMEALKAMAAVVGARVDWLRCHPRPGMTWRGRAFDVTDGSKPRWCGSCDHGMLYRRVYVHSRIRRAVAAVDGALLRRPRRMAKPAWSGPGYVVTGNRLPAMGASRLARRGYGWVRILRVFLPRVRVVWS